MANPEQPQIEFKVSESAKQVIILAEKIALGLKDEYVSTEHLLLALTMEKNCKDAMEGLGINVENIRSHVLFVMGKSEIDFFLSTGGSPIEHIKLSQTAMGVFNHSVNEARKDGLTRITSIDLLKGILRVREGVGSAVLNALNIDPQKLFQLRSNEENK